MYCLKAAFGKSNNGRLGLCKLLNSVYFNCNATTLFIVRCTPQPHLLLKQTTVLSTSMLAMKL